MKLNVKKIILFLFISYTLSLCAQNDQGTITYERTLDYVRMIDALPYMSEEDKAIIKLSRSNTKRRSQPFNLTFDPDQSVYTYGKKEEASTYSWRQDEFLLINKPKSRAIQHQVVIGDKLVVVDDQQPKRKWKVMNELREIEGYMCVKAVTKDTTKNQTITAWFTNQIPISSGPEGFGDLPGMILMLDINDGTCIIEATSITTDIPQHPIPKKLKGKRVSHAKYQEMISKFMKESIKNKRNPYWYIRY